MYLERFRLNGRRALVTGAARGIGLSIAEALAEAGAHVILTDMGDAAQDAAKGLAEKGYSVEATSLDVTDRAAVDALAEAGLRLGGRGQLEKVGDLQRRQPRQGKRAASWA